MSRASRLLAAGYRQLLRFYPAPFRAEFGAEMHQVFCRTVEDAAPAGGSILIKLAIREMLDWPGALGREWACLLQARFRHFREENMEERSSAPNPASDAPAAWNQAILAALALLVPGLVLAARELPIRFWWWPVLMIGAYAFCLLCLLAGWVKGFPRWSYPYGLTSLIFALYLPAVSLYRLQPGGYRFGDPISPRTWLGLAAVAIIALLLTRSLRPLGRLFQGAWRDWTRLSFAVYGILPWPIWIFFDEVERSYHAAFVIICTLFLAAGALATMRARTASGRALSMVSGMTAAWLIATAGLAGYWRGPRVRGYPPFHWSDNIGPMAVAWVFFVAIMLMPALLGLLRRAVRPRGAV